MKNEATGRRAEPEVVASRTTFDGVRVYLHADGSLSCAMYFLRGRLPVSLMWRVAKDLCVYTWAELPQLLRDVRSGKWADAKRRAAECARNNAVPESERVYRNTYKLANGLMACVRVR